MTILTSEEYCIDCNPRQRAYLQKLIEKQERVQSWESQMLMT